jgi:hypothetical protein
MVERMQDAADVQLGEVKGHGSIVPNTAGVTKRAAQFQ